LYDKVPHQLMTKTSLSRPRYDVGPSVDRLTKHGPFRYLRDIDNQVPTSFLACLSRKWPDMLQSPYQMWLEFRGTVTLSLYG